MREAAAGKTRGGFFHGWRAGGSVVVRALPDVEELIRGIVAVLLGEEAAGVVEAFFGPEQALLARTAVRHVDAGRLVVLDTGR